MEFLKSHLAFHSEIICHIFCQNLLYCINGCPVAVICSFTNMFFWWTQWRVKSGFIRSCSTANFLIISPYALSLSIQNTIWAYWTMAPLK